MTNAGGLWWRLRNVLGDYVDTSMDLGDRFLSGFFGLPIIDVATARWVLRNIESPFWGETALGWAVEVLQKHGCRLDDKRAGAVAATIMKRLEYALVKADVRWSQEIAVKVACATQFLDLINDSVLNEYAAGWVRVCTARRLLPAKTGQKEFLELILARCGDHDEIIPLLVESPDAEIRKLMWTGCWGAVPSSDAPMQAAGGA